MSVPPRRALVGALALTVATTALATTTAAAEPRAVEKSPAATRVFNRTATFPAYANTADPSQEAVAEISTR